MKYWLMKSEPSELSIDRLKVQKSAPWTGVRNYQARNFMRDEMAIGDLVVFYHSSCDEIGAAGIAKVASLPYPDHTQFDERSDYFDPKATKESPRWIMVDVKFVKKFLRIISRDELQSSRKLKNLWLWNHHRLSIIPLTKNEYDAIVTIAQ